MKYKLTEKGIETTFVPERDLFRLLKYGTYDLIELDMLTPEIVPFNEFTNKEYNLINKWWNEYAPTEDEEQ